ncbi:MAG: hypothetical protein ACREAG_00970 [Nitrosopumilaceae archaeon]
MIKKGLERVFNLDPEVATTMRRIEEKAYKTLVEDQLTHEKEILPQLQEECIKWCRENNLNKIVKAEVEAFLAEKEIPLSSEAERKLWQKVNISLKSRPFI